MSDNSAIKILIADPFPIVHAGLKQILNIFRDIEIVGQTTSGLETIRLARQLNFTMLIIEIALHDKSGIEVIKQLKKELPHISIVVFSSLREDQYAVRSLKAGASGFIHKNSSQEILVGAIRQIASGLKFISPALAQEMANNINSDFDNEPHKILSDREYQTLILIASGKSVSDIAKDLSLSVKTISEYRARILFKMKLRHNAEITHYAIKNQLVEE
jgi:two-component system invasion response regulator UvrY